MIYKYTCSIDVCKPKDGVYRPLSGLVVLSEVKLCRRELRLQVVNLVPEQYVGFGAMYCHEEKVVESVTGN